MHQNCLKIGIHAACSVPESDIIDPKQGTNRPAVEGNDFIPLRVSNYSL